MRGNGGDMNPSKRLIKPVANTALKLFLQSDPDGNLDPLHIKKQEPLYKGKMRWEKL